jgi:hypothetical protein
LSLPAPKTGPPEPTAANSLDEEVFEMVGSARKSKMAERLIGV